MRAECSLEHFVTRAPNRKLIENLQEIKLGSQQVLKASDYGRNLIRLILVKISVKFLEPPNFFSESSYGSREGKLWLYRVAQKLSKDNIIYYFSDIPQTLK